MKKAEEKTPLYDICGGVYALMYGTTNISWDLTLGMFAKSTFTTELFNFDLS